MSRKSGILILSVAGFLLSVSAARAAQAPHPVSPGNPSGTARISDRCPTFLWGAAGSAASDTSGNQPDTYELVVYQVTPASDPRIVLERTLPGSAQGWKPSLEECLEPGGRYAWSLRAVSDDGTGERGEWSEARLFEVTVAPSVGEVEEAIAVLQRYSESERSESERLPAGKGRAVDHDDPLASPALEPLRSETLGAGSTAAPVALAIPSAISLSIDGDLDLGGNVFKGGVPLLHSTATSTALGRRALENGPPARNTAIGGYALLSATTGYDNTAIGGDTLKLLTTGKWNTAVGDTALFFNDSGSSNTAVGESALLFSQSSSNNVAVGRRALVNAKGVNNTAIGTNALDALGSIGNSNIALGFNAGANLTNGSSNIYIDNRGAGTQSGMILIGRSGAHTKAAIAGDLGLGTESPINRLHVIDAISGGANLTNHVARIENLSAATSPDVLALSLSGVTTPTNATNFITFFASGGTAVGAVEGDGAGGVTYKSGSGDFAEYLPRLDPSEDLQPGEVVGLYGGEVSRRTQDADRMLVVTTRPIILGNDPSPEDRDRYTPVAFLGQVPVRVRGPVRAGDLLLASARDDGQTVAVPPEELRFEQVSRIVGRALEASEENGSKLVKTLVGLADPEPLYRLFDRQQAMIQKQAETLEELHRRVMRVESTHWRSAPATPVSDPSYRAEE